MIMNKFLILLSIINLINSVILIDPDIELCRDQTIDAVVNSDDGLTYIFKGEYFWLFDYENGVSTDYAQLISDHWSDLPPFIDTAFAIEDITHGNATVFIKERNWYMYKNRILIQNGDTLLWEKFPTLRIDASFIIKDEFEDEASAKFIYFLYNTEYSKYRFYDVNNPQLLDYGRTITVGHFLMFLGKERGLRTNTTIQNVIKVHGAVANSDYLIIFGYKNYCKVNIKEDPKLCNTQDSSKYLNCPRNTRPSTLTTITTTMSAETFTSPLDRTDTEFLTEFSTPSSAESGETGDENGIKGYLFWFGLLFLIMTFFGVSFCVGIVLFKKRKGKIRSVTMSLYENGKSHPKSASIESFGSMDLERSNITDFDENRYFNKSVSKKEMSKCDRNKRLSQMDSQKYSRSEESLSTLNNNETESDFVEADQLMDEVKSWILQPEESMKQIIKSKGQ